MGNHASGTQVRQEQKGHVRAFILSSELFPPNVAKHGATTSMSVPVPADTDRMKRVIEFIAQKRGKGDLILFFDGRSRSCRRAMEESEEMLTASGAHTLSCSCSASLSCALQPKTVAGLFQP